MLRYIVLVLICTTLFCYGYVQSLQPKSVAAFLGLGLGNLTPQTIIYWSLNSSGTSGFIANILVANTPQLILSTAHFTYNVQFTFMLAGLKWSKFAYQRRGLRVSSHPTGAQKSTHFLQLPYRYAIPILGMFGTTQWLISQSLFSLAVERYDMTGVPVSYDGADCETYGFRCGHDNAHYTCAWSPLAVFLTIFAGMILIGFVFITGRRRYAAGVPLGSTNSAVLSAACHSGERSDREEIGSLRLRWGVVGPEGGEASHCALTSRECTFPEDGKLYE